MKSLVGLINVLTMKEILTKIKRRNRVDLVLIILKNVQPVQMKENVSLIKTFATCTLAKHLKLILQKQKLQLYKQMISPYFYKTLGTCSNIANQSYRSSSVVFLIKDKQNIVVYPVVENKSIFNLGKWMLISGFKAIKIAKESKMVLVLHLLMTLQRQQCGIKEKDKANRIYIQVKKNIL